MPRELDYIPLDSIRTNPVALRDVNKESEDFILLVDSIKREGVNNPINVRRKKIQPDDGKEYELIDGLQRFTASCEAGTGAPGTPGVIPAQILEKDDAESLISQVISNAHRIETKPVEYARSLMRILGFNPTWTESQLAAALSRTPAWISKQLGLLKLHDQIKPLVNEGKVPLINAYTLAKLPQEEQLNFLERAQTQGAPEFTPVVLERVKAIRDANRKGENASPEEFVPVAHLRKKPEIEGEMDKPAVAPMLITELGIAKQAGSKEEAAVAGFQLGLKWALNFDPKSIEAAKQKDAERRKRDEEAKIRRDAERKDKRAKELKEREAKASKEAEEARSKAAALPVAEEIPV